MKRRAFKIGYVVRVDTPLHVVRVGYPKCVADYQDRAHALIPTLDKWLRDAGIAAPEGHVYTAMVNPLSRLMLRADMFGGKERTIHTERKDDWAGREGVVRSIRRRKTGTYRPGETTGGSWDLEPEYYPPYLEDEKTHTLLTVNAEFAEPWRVEIEVEACHTTFIREATAEELEAATR